MRTRKISVMTMTAVALGLALTACSNDGAGNASSATSSSSAAAASTPRADTAESKVSGTSAQSSGAPAQSDVKCTDQLDYAGDPRSNAEINSIGEDTGTCPPVEPK